MALLSIACHTQAELLVDGCAFIPETEEKKKPPMKRMVVGGMLEDGYKTVLSVVCAPKAIKVNFLIE